MSGPCGGSRNAGWRIELWIANAKTSHLADFGTRVESSDSVVQLSGGLVAGQQGLGPRNQTAAAVAGGRDAALYRRHVFERRVRCKLRRAIPPRTADSIGRHFRTRGVADGLRAAG